MSTEVTTTTTDSPLAALLSDPARLNEVPIETVKELWAIQKEMDEKQAKRDFSAAMNKVQGELEPVRKLGRNPQTGSMFAKAEDIDRMMTPHLDANGFSVSSSTKPSELPEHLKIVLLVRHIGGHEETHALDAPIDDKGMGGKTNKTRLHGMSSTLSYVTRVLKCNVFNLELMKDTDGNRPRSPDPITDEQVATLRSLREEVGMNGPALLRHFQVQALEELPASRYREAVALLEAKRNA